MGTKGKEEGAGPEQGSDLGPLVLLSQVQGIEAVWRSRQPSQPEALGSEGGGSAFKMHL